MSDRAAFGKPFSYTLFGAIDPNVHKTWLIDDLLGAGELSVWYGAPGCGKSALAADAAAHVAAGRPWFGRRVELGAVLFVAAERAELTKRRLAAWGMANDIDDIPLAIMAGSFNLATEADDAERTITTCKALEAATGNPVVWIIVDTKAQVLGGGDENGPRDMMRLINNLGRIQRETRAHITVIDHVAQNGGSTPRGHGALIGAVDTSCQILHGKPARSMKVVKENDGNGAGCITFDFESVTISIDPETGKETTAAIVVPGRSDASADDNTANRGKPPTRAEKAFQVLLDVVGENDHAPVSVWRTALEDHFIKHEGPNYQERGGNNQRDLWRMVQEKFTKEGKISIEGDVVSVLVSEKSHSQKDSQGRSDKHVSECVSSPPLKGGNTHTHTPSSRPDPFADTLQEIEGELGPLEDDLRAKTLTLIQSRKFSTKEIIEKIRHDLYVVAGMANAG